MKKQVSKIRLITQIAFFLFIAILTVAHVLAESGVDVPLIGNVSLHAICPFGGVETFLSWVSMGILVKKIHYSALVMMFIIFALTLLFGPVFCGWVCPLGAIQEWVGKLGRKLFGKKYNRFITTPADRYLRLLRYASLLITIYLTTKALTLVFVEVDPYYALFHFWNDEATFGGIVVLVITLGLSLVMERPWCRYFCPYGALLGLFNKIRIFSIHRRAESCVQCGACERACPVGIDVSKHSVIRDTRCISCLQCTSEQSCPINNNVALTTKGGLKHEN